MDKTIAVSLHEDYFETVPVEVRPQLELIQAKVESLLPDITRCISYKMPAFKATRVFFYFAAFKKHIGIYPPVKGDVALIQGLAPYRGEKGNLTFPLDQPLPIGLIGRVALALYLEYEAK